MSSALAIAGVTAVLADLLNNGVVNNDLTAVMGTVKVSARPPDRVTQANSAESNQLNLFLYHVAPNPGWRNVGLPSRDETGVRLTNPPLALDLFYLLTAYGEKDFNAEILLGYAMQLLHETPVLTRNAIRTALTGTSKPVTGSILPTGFNTIAAGDLADQVEQIKITPLSMSTEEMSKLWTALQTGYRPTAAYQVCVVLIESNFPTKKIMPVLKPFISLKPFRYPVIDRVENADGPNMPILSNSTILIQGRQLRADNTGVLIGGISLVSTQYKVTDSQITVTLPPSGSVVLRAGVQGVQIVQYINLGDPPTPHNGVESGVATFVLHPKITVPASVSLSSGQLTITFDPKVEKSQRVILLLGELNPPPDRPAICFSIPAPPDNGITSTAQTDTGTITFSFQEVITQGMTAGQYLVSVQVDGAENLFTTDSTSGKFNGPVVNIT